ncbi:hypothetical protein ACFPK1_12715 [Actinomycetospora rhizophila]|uniref:Sigma-70 family RNA polymerase sigma factor n=1 Tax=Actinomycetospora rhizophila TaxID=1416876 RepID=A0ABV9ZFX4_9PSEU
MYEFSDLAALYQQASADDFRGPAWRKLTTLLVNYALPRLSQSIANRSIFEQLAEHRLPYSRSPLRPQEHEVEELALDAVFRGLQYLVRRAREGRGWTPDGGANLTSWFYGDCLREFSNAWRSWLRSNGWRLLEYQDIADLASLADTRYGPEDWAIYYDILERLAKSIRDPVTLRILRMRLDGYDFRTIADDINCSEEATRRRYYRFIDRRRRERGEVE